MKVTAIGNRKGGVGKTSVTLGLATALRLAGKKVLVIDMDPQANLTEAMEAVGEYNVLDILHEGDVGTLGQAATPAGEHWGVDIITSPGAKLAHIETDSIMAPEFLLRTAAHESPELEAYDHVLIDLPPALGRLTLNALIWANDVLVVTEPERFSVNGVAEFLDTVRRIQAKPHLNPALRVKGIVVNKVSANAEHKFQMEQLEVSYPDMLLDPVLPLRTAVRDSISSGVPLTKLGGEGAALMRERFLDLARHMDKEN